MAPRLPPPHGRASPPPHRRCGDHQQSVLALRHHRDKVQALAWHPAEQALLLSAAYDARACVADVRSPGAARSWQLGVGSDPEAVAWDPHRPHLFVVSSEDGTVRCFDARSDGEAVWDMRAHRKAASAVDFNPAAAGVLATGSADKTVRAGGGRGACCEARGASPRLRERCRSSCGM